jgi:hypothetical protein
MAQEMSRRVAEEWERTLQETPDPWKAYGEGPPFGPRLTYRERLDRQPRNGEGALIPRIVTVRRNLRRLKWGG